MTIDHYPEPLRKRRSHVDMLSEQSQRLKVSQQDIQLAIAGHRSFSPEAEKNNIGRLEKIAEELTLEIAGQEDDASHLELRLGQLISRKTNPILIWKYLSDEQKEIREESGRLKKHVETLKQQLSSNRSALNNARRDIEAAHMRLSEHEAFNLFDAEKRLWALGPEIARINDDLSSARFELQRLEGQVQPHLQELARLKSMAATLNEEIEQANVFERGLSSASNGYERAKIHEKCEARFGIGRPKQVINERRGKIRGIENNISKLDRRIREELQKLERTVRHLIIDGNNVCYEGETFIGLLAISALLSALRGRYKTTVVFDASIRALLKTDDQGIKKELGALANTHVAPTRTGADEFLMKLAGEKADTYILSNDRFAEFHEYDVVKSKRVLRFLIAEGKIISNDIDLDVSYG